MDKSNIEFHYCNNKCCKIEVISYKNLIPVHHSSPELFNRKAGVFLYSPKEQRILLVQSRGFFWGLPKGTVEEESISECAIRELKEETGITVESKDFLRVITVKNKAMYFYIEKDIESPHIQFNDTESKNDVNGITWIKLDCLRECLESGTIVLNQHCRIAFKKFLDITFPDVKFIKVIRKKSK